MSTMIRLIFKKQTARAKKYVGYVRYRFTSLDRRKQIAVVLGGLVLVGLFIFLIVSSDGATPESAKQLREVETASAASLSRNGATLELSGRVLSQTEANLRTQTQGEVVGVYRTVGSFVQTGTIIAEIRNQSERASVAQAQASVEQAEANLAKAQGGTRQEQLAILELNRNTAAQSFDTAKASAVSTLLDIYADMEDAVLRKADLVLTEAFSSTYDFTVQTPNSGLVTSIENDRVQADVILDRLISTKQVITTGTDLEAEIIQTQADIRFLIDLQDDIVTALTDGISTPQLPETTINAHRTENVTSRNTLNTALSTLSSTLDTLNVKQNALNVAQKNLEQGVTGERTEDVLAVEASLRQAQAQLQVARAALEKTFIRTPISGTINTLSLRRGDFVSAFEFAATVSNNNALEIETFITENDRRTIQIGDPVLVANRYQGTITSIASGVDPITRKIEVKIGLEDEEEVSLTHGTTVRLVITNESSPEDLLGSEEIRIPISAIKLEPNRVIVFRVTEENKLEALEVAEGRIIGNRITIEEGLEPQTVIVVDARGLREGQEVLVRQ